MKIDWLIDWLLLVLHSMCSKCVSVSVMYYTLNVTTANIVFDQLDVV